MWRLKNERPKRKKKKCQKAKSRYTFSSRVSSTVVDRSTAYWFFSCASVYFFFHHFCLVYTRIAIDGEDEEILSVNLLLLQRMASLCALSFLVFFVKTLAYVRTCCSSPSAPCTRDTKNRKQFENYWEPTWFWRVWHINKNAYSTNLWILIWIHPINRSIFLLFDINLCRAIR